jgi:hypothetical protein
MSDNREQEKANSSTNVTEDAMILHYSKLITMFSAKTNIDNLIKCR